MPSPLEQYSDLHTNRFMTGLWTNRNQLRDADTTFLYEKFYSASRYDSMLGGLNAELTPKMSIARRPGFSIYATLVSPRMNRFYSFRTFSTNAELIRVMADTLTDVREVTPGQQKVIYTKSANSADSTFKSLGNDLFFGNSTDQKKWKQTTLTWQPTTLFQPGDQVIDSHGNIQVAIGAQTANIATVEVDSVTATITIQPGSLDMRLFGDVPFLFAGLTTVTGLNGMTLGVLSAADPLSFIVLYSGTPAAAAPDTGTISTGTGISGATPPLWDLGLTELTFDGDLVWRNKGPNLMKWGIAPPTVAPTLSQQPLSPVPYPNWEANTFYWPTHAIIDSSNNIELLTTEGVIGASAPAWSPTRGTTTADGTAVWTNEGTSVWLGGTAYSLNDYSTFSGYLYQALNPGTSGTDQSSWVTGEGAEVTDGSVTWLCLGHIYEWSTLPPSGAIAMSATILDTNGYAETIQDPGGITAGTQPTWAATGSFTDDFGAVWLNAGAVTPIGTSQIFYAYAYRNSSDPHTSTSSPISLPLTRRKGNITTLQGPTSADTQVDTIVIYRTPVGGSILLELDSFPSPLLDSWTYAETLATIPDTALNELLPAVINSANNPPPVGFRPLAYHLSRIFGAVNNVLSWSNGTDQVGDPNQSFDPSNFFVFPAKITYAWACILGLIVYTVSDVYIVLGTATDADPLFPKLYIEGLGLLSYDAFTVNKTTPYLMNSTKQVLALDPSSGLIEPGFPIADLFDAEFDASTAKLAWHEGAHGDTALYVGDGVSNWYRMAALSAPEQGLVWSPKGTLAVGYSAMQSVETSPGQKELLFGPAATGLPILFRDKTVNLDNDAAFPWDVIIGSIVLAQPGEIAAVAFLTLESQRVGTRPTIGVLLGEIDGATTGGFENIPYSRQDPTLQPPSKTLYNDRYYMMQSQQTVRCRHLQIQFNWIAEDAYNELFTYTLYGALEKENLGMQQ